jgi:FkbM family methyltransferase
MLCLQIQNFYKLLKGIFDLVRKIENKLYPQHNSFTANVSFSQCGEDILIDYVFKLRGLHEPSYIDIGANHPFYFSNTAKFYERGCQGINIEANPELIKLFKKYRTRDINLNIGIGDTESELDFYIMQDNTLSTFSKKERDFMVSRGKQFAETKKIKLTTVAKVLQENFNGTFPDFMSLDVEGMDFQILRSIDFEQSYPKVICVEASEYSPIGAGARRNELIDFLVSKGYYEYANTNLNAIMVKNEFWFQ